jgi:POT family proton-dependent oligopeptide transporter
MPAGIPYIIGNEAAERFCFYGMRAILVIYMTQYLRDRTGALAPMNENQANQWYHLFVASNYFFPAIGAIIADAFLGKYRTVFWLSLVYCAGCLALALDDTRLGLILGLGFIALGAGGIKPCVASNVGDQFGSSNQHLLSRAFGWFYFSVNFGSFFSILLTPILLKQYGPKIAFGVPAVLMFVATFIFWAGRYKFVHIPPGGKTFLRDTFNREGFKTIGRVAIIYAFVAVFWSLWDQSGGEWVLQAEKMNLNFLGINWLSSQIQAVNGIMILAFIPLFQYVVYPAINSFWTLTPLRKIGLGIFTIGVAFLISAWIESQISAGLKPSIGWQLPAYVLLSAGEVMTSITALEFAYTQAPKHMKAIMQALYLLSISAGNAFTALVHWFIANPDGTTKLHGASFYIFFSVLSMVAAIVFAFVALRYREVAHLQDEAPGTAT